MDIVFPVPLLFLLLGSLLPSLSWISASSAASIASDGDLGLSLGSSAATKLVRNAVNSALRSPRFIEVDLASREGAQYSVAHVYSLNRVAVAVLDVQFDDNEIRVEARNLVLNSTSRINMTSLPLFLNEKRQVPYISHFHVKKAFLRLSIDNTTTIRVRQCELDYSDLDLFLERSFFLNLLLGVVRGTLSDSMLRDKVCSLLLGTALDLREKYLIDIPFVQLIPAKFVPYLLSSTIHIRSRLESVVTDNEQLIVTAIIDWTERTPAQRSSFLNTLPVDLLHDSGDPNVKLENGEEETESVEGTIPNDQSKSRPRRDKFYPKSSSELTNSSAQSAVRERLLLWINDTMLNELLEQFRWDFKLIEESIPLNSPKLPAETRDFFANICPQCIFIFNVSADGLPTISIESDSIVATIHNRIAAEVLNPSLGVAGQKKTAIDLNLSLSMQMVPQIKDGIFHTRLNLKERKIDMRNGTAFPKHLKNVVEELLQDMIKDDLWPVVKRELEPLIYNKGVELPNNCGVDPKSAQLHFEPGKLGVSATLKINQISFGQCFSQFKSKLPNPAEIFKIRTGDVQSLRDLAENLKKR